MAVPGYQEFMLPLLKIAEDGQEHTVSEAMNTIANAIGMTEQDRDELLPSGTQTRFYNRVTWATTYLSKSLLLEKCGRGVFKITPRGREVLAKHPLRIDNSFLEQFPEYKAFKTKRAENAAETRATQGGDVSIEDPVVTPDERLDGA